MEIKISLTELYNRTELNPQHEHDQTEGWNVRPGVTHFIMPCFHSAHTTVDDLKHGNWIIMTQDVLP